MAIPSLNSSQVPNHPTKEVPKFDIAAAKEAANALILKSIEPQLNAKQQPFELLYHAAITKLNEELEPVFGPNAIQEGAAAAIDVSPEATAERIVSMSTAFYFAFKEQHKGEDEAEVLDKFMETIGRGIEKGFKEAREILDGLGVLQGDIADNIDKTYDLVQNGLTNFRQQFESEDDEKSGNSQ